MQDSKFLMYPIKGPNTFDTISSYMYDPENITVENNLTNFIQYAGNHKRIFYIEESIVYHKLNLPEISDADLETLKDVYWVFDTGHGSAPVVVLPILLKIIERYKIDVNNLIFLSNSDNEIEHLKEIYKDSESQPKCICLRGNELIAVRDYLQADIDKRFLFLSRNFNPMRLTMFLDLKIRGVLDNAFYTFYHIENPYTKYPYSYRSLDDLNGQLYSYLDNNNSSWAKTIIDYWEENKHILYAAMPYSLHEETIELNGKIGQQTTGTALRKTYANSYMSLLVETNFYDNANMFQPTEKIARTMLFKHPFLVYSNVNFLSRLVKHGYKTFSPFLDESYDLLENGHDRIVAIGQEAERLNNLSTLDFKKLMYNVTETVNYNHSVIQDKLINFTSRIEFPKDAPELSNLFSNRPPNSSWFMSHTQK